MPLFFLFCECIINVQGMVSCENLWCVVGEGTGTAGGNLSRDGEHFVAEETGARAHDKGVTRVAKRNNIHMLPNHQLIPLRTYPGEITDE